MLSEDAIDTVVSRTLDKFDREIMKIDPVLYEDILTADFHPKFTHVDKYTIAEITYDFNGYDHHFIGVSAKHPKDKRSAEGEINALREALCQLIVRIIARKKRYDEKQQNREINRLFRDASRMRKNGDGMQMTGTKMHEMLNEFLHSHFPFTHLHRKEN